MGRDFDESMVGRVFYRPIDHLWFLAYLFIYYMVALLLRRFDPMAVGVASLAIGLLPVGGNFHTFFFTLGFFMIGFGLSLHHDWWDRVVNNKLWIVAGAVSFLVMLYFTVTMGSIRYNSLFAPLVLACVFGACILIQLIRWPKGLRGVSFLGKESLIFYVLHYPLILVFLVALRAAAPGLPELLELGLSILVTLFIGTLLVHGTNHVPGMSWLFRFGGSRVRRHAIGG